MTIHAGMGKAGSSSIQAWMAERAAALRERDIDLLVARLRRDNGRAVDLDVRPFRWGQIQSNDIIIAYRSAGLDKQAVFERVFSGLDEAATRHRETILTAEALQRFFWVPDEDFLRGLESLAGRHRVRVAYYVRPQHSALEAFWRQWGFRSGRPPSEDLALRTKALRYAQTREVAARLCPSVSFEVRPFRHDLLAEGDPATDFARAFVGIEELEPDGQGAWANRGLPLEVVNALRRAPDGLFWDTNFDNDRLARIKKVLGDLDAPASETTQLSRAVLRAFCHDTYEHDNRRLIEELGWMTDAFVPDAEIDPALRERGLSALDELWEPHASATELAALYAGLDRAITLLHERAGMVPARRPLRARVSSRLARLPGRRG